MEHRSFFSYNITRAYPLKWFTPVAVVGGIVATALVSFMNVAATGYELVSTSSSDPNATEANSIWFSRWPSYLVGARASCDATNIPLQSTLYTDKGAFPYTLSNVWQLGDDGSKQHQGSLIYKNSPVQNCNATLINIQFEGPDRPARQLEAFTMGGTVTATTQCYVDEGLPARRTYFELISTYDPLPAREGALSTFPNLNRTRDPSQYWGSSILNVYWATVMQAFFDQNVGGDDPFFKGVIDLEQNTTLAGTMEDRVSNVEFLRVRDCFFIPLNSTGIAFLYNRYCNSSSITTLANSAVAFERPVPGIWLSVAVLGKAMWFAVLADLGRNDDSMPNMLARPNLLANLSSNLTQANQTLRIGFRFAVDHSDISMQSFDPAQSPDVHLAVNQSILASDYLCQVPRLKSPGNLILSVLVADLVILQAIWTVFRLVVDKFYIKDTEQALYCTSCTPQSQGQESPGVYESIDGQESEVILLQERSPSHI
ncbi:hypothetical protein F5Y05DRAFT_424788 [Hypoxylon sp. FL0543]|nr:hypothetical protein F5Y05DRAFT_424788 [Hypoxylon sp. FL0543]